MSTPNSHRNRQRYGLATFFAATVNVLLGTTIAWVSCPYLFLALYFGPMLVIDVLVAAVLVSLRGLASSSAEACSSACCRYRSPRRPSGAPTWSAPSGIAGGETATPVAVHTPSHLVP